MKTRIAVRRQRRGPVFSPAWIMCTACTIAILVSGVTLSSATEEHVSFYYVRGERIELQPVPGRIVLAAVDEFERSVLWEELDRAQGVSAEVLSNGLLEVQVPAEELRNHIESLRADPRVACAEPAYRYRDKPLWITGSLLVTLQGGASLADLSRVADSLDAVVTRRLKAHSEVYRLDLLPGPRELDTLDVAELFRSREPVRSVDPNFSCIPWSVTEPTDTYFSWQWAHQNRTTNIGTSGCLGTYDADIDAFEPGGSPTNPLCAWDLSHGSSSVTIAILDTGVDLGHPDLQDNLDLLNSTDTTQSPTPPGVGGPGSPACEEDGDGHGTLVAGTAAAVWNNGAGVTGLAPGIKIMSVRVGYHSGLSADDLLEGINWAWTNGADVINMSLHLPLTSAITDELEDARNQGRNGLGTVVVCASGNDWYQPVDGVDFPASDPTTIAVGASSPCDQRISDFNGDDCGQSGCVPGSHCWDSQYGPELDVVAPGIFMYNTDMRDHLSGPGQCGFAQGEYTPDSSGTSVASPLLGAAAALILSIAPELPVDGVRGFIADSAEQIQVWNGSSWVQLNDDTFDDQSGWGRLNAFHALLAVQNRDDSLVHANAGNTHLYPNQVKETGTSQANGFNTLREGILVLADGGQLVLGAGNYHADELSKPMTLTATGGGAVITALP